MDWSLNNYWIVILAIAVPVVVVARWWRMRMRRGKDILWPAFPDDLGWADAAAADAALGEIYKYAIGFCSGSVAWYQSRRKPKRVAGFLLRVAALVATFVAGLVPLSGDLGLAGIKPQVTTVLLALAGLFISIDNFGGFTSGWVRYMLAQQKLERARDSFLMEWNALKAGASERQAMLEKSKAFLLCVGKIVDDETLEWATEFQNALKELERARKSAADTPRTGALEITVRNPHAVSGWTLEIDGNQRGSASGRTLAVTEVLTGQRKLRVSGSDSQGKVFSDEKIVTVEGGMTATRDCELS